MSEAPLILIVEDEPQMRRFLRTMLHHNGYRTLEAINGVQAVEMARSPELALVLLDLGLPDVDGTEVLSHVREFSEAPIVVISARHYEFAKIEALDLGANDYVTKPFGAGELLARIRVVLRARPAQAASESSTKVVSIGQLEINLDDPIVKLDGEDVQLTPTEHKLLAVLARRAGRVVSHAELLRDVWGPDSIEQIDYLRVFMRRLRYKLEPEPTQPRYLLTVSGTGYRLKAANK